MNLALKDEKLTAKQCLRYCLHTFVTFKDETEPLADRYEYKIVLCFWRLAIHPMYKALFMILMFTDVVILASAKHEDVTEDYKAR